jgi:hypothetical protein
MRRFVCLQDCFLTLTCHLVLTIEFGCEYCQQTLRLGDTHFNKVSADDLLQTMRNMDPILDTSRVHVPSLTGSQRLPATHHQHTQWSHGEIFSRVSDQWTSKVGDAEGNTNNVLPLWGATGTPPRKGWRTFTGKSSGNFHHKGGSMT